MKNLVRLVLVMLFAGTAFAAANGESVAFVADQRGDVSIEGVSHPMLMTELAKGQKVALARDAAMTVMFIRTGREFGLAGPGDFVVNDDDVSAVRGAKPAARQTEWRTNSKVLIQVAQASGASLRMRGFIHVNPDPSEPRLLYPVKDAVSTLQPTFRWAAGDLKPPFEIMIAFDGKPLLKASASEESYRLPVKLKPGSEYSWEVNVAGREVGRGRFRTLDKEELARAEKQKPAEKAEFSDQLMFALMLHEMGATQDAQDVWARLSRERPDLPELASFVRNR